MSEHIQLEIKSISPLVSDSDSDSYSESDFESDFESELSDPENDLTPDSDEEEAAKLNKSRKYFPEIDLLLTSISLDGSKVCYLEEFLKNLDKHGVLICDKKQTKLTTAARNENIEDLRNLAEDPETCLDLQNSTGNTALHYAAAKDSTATSVKFLIGRNADLNVLNLVGKTPLHKAMENNNVEAIKALVKAGADLSIADSEGTIRDKLTKYYPDIMSSEIINQNDVGARRRNVTYAQLFKLLLQSKFNEFLRELDYNKHLLKVNNECFTFLQFCCLFAPKDVVEDLLKLGADPNVDCGYAKTPLKLASQIGRADILSLFLTYQPNVDFNSMNLRRMLHWTVEGKETHNNWKGSDHFECLNLLLTTVPKSVLDINEQDSLDNTALYYAAKLRQHKMVLLLLDHGAYIGMTNTYGEAMCTHITYDTFSQYLDSCIVKHNAKPKQQNEFITFYYGFLIPKKNKIQQSETLPLLQIGNNRELRPLLKHPIFTSFLQLKWLKVRYYIYLNILFYALFLAALTTHILKMKMNMGTNENITVNQTLIDENSTNDSQIKEQSIDFISFPLGILILRELFQLLISPFQYLCNKENWLDISVIIITICLLLNFNDEFQIQISAIGIMISWLEFALLVGRLPTYSVNIHMLKKVSYTFLKMIIFYSFLIIAFALSFYLLFKQSPNQNSEHTLFDNPLLSLFKAIIMATGEFEAGSIPFAQFPVASYMIFTLFVFMVAIVLYNLLNGLAVSDTQAIISDAELLSIISRVKLITFLESILDNKVTKILSKCLPRHYSTLLSLSLARSLQNHHTVIVILNKHNKISPRSFKTFSSTNQSSGITKWILEKTRNKAVHMDPSIIQQASRIVMDAETLRRAEEKENDRNLKLMKEIECLKAGMNCLTEKTDNKKVE